MDAELEVKELPEGTEAYDAYVRQTTEMLGREVNHFAFAHAFDIKLVNPETGEARSMGIEFGPDGDLYMVDNPGWTGRADLIRTGRILRIHFDDARIKMGRGDDMVEQLGIRFHRYR